MNFAARTRLALVATLNKTAETLVLFALRATGSTTPGSLSRGMLNRLHAMMLAQVARVRADAPKGHAMSATNGVANSAVVLAPADANWRRDADREAAAVAAALGVSCRAVHHIGSTAVEDLVAKPIIDLAAEIEGTRLKNDFAAVRAALAAQGYRYLGVRGGHFFEKRPAEVRTHALQVHATASPELTELLRFRDALRADAGLRADYAATKAALAAHFPRQRLLYVTYKFHWIAEHQWRQAGSRDWADWFVAHKRRQAELARRGT